MNTKNSIIVLMLSFASISLVQAVVSEEVKEYVKATKVVDKCIKKQDPNCFCTALNNVPAIPADLPISPSLELSALIRTIHSKCRTQQCKTAMFNVLSNHLGGPVNTNIYDDEEEN